MTGVEMTGIDELGRDLEQAIAARVARTKRRRPVVRAGVAAACVALLVAVAAAAETLIGSPAPEDVRLDFRALDRGLPEDLRAIPDVDHARAVAVDGESVLYAASLKGGGYCTEIVTAGASRRGATCSARGDASASSIAVTLPTSDRAGAWPVVIGGRVGAATATKLELRYPDGGAADVPLGVEGFYVFNVPASDLEAVHGGELELVARDAQGAQVASAIVPADWDDPVVPDDTQPLYVNAHSRGDDLTKLYGFDGFVTAQATSLALVYDAAERVAIPIGTGNRFSYEVPEHRSGDFMRPRLLVARDARGNVVAEKPVAAVAYWVSRARDR